jgi:hypothetical protein
MAKSTEDLANASACSLSILTGNTLIVAPGNALTVGTTTFVAAGASLNVGVGYGVGSLLQYRLAHERGNIQVGSHGANSPVTLNIAGDDSGAGGRARH